MTTYKKTPMEQVNICTTKKEDLNLDYILENTNTIEGEECLDKILEYVKVNFEKSSNTSIEIIESLLKNNESEYLLDYSNEAFLAHPKLFLNYFSKHNDSSILNALKELYSFFAVDYNKNIYDKINKNVELTAKDKDILKSINPNLTSNN